MAREEALAVAAMRDGFYVLDVQLQVKKHVACAALAYGIDWMAGDGRIVSCSFENCQMQVWE